MPSMAETQLDRAIAAALAELARPAQTVRFDAERYVAAFRSSAQDKAASVLALLRRDPHFSNRVPVYVSIGGGDGEELEQLLAGSRGIAGILIEMHPALAAMARSRRLADNKKIEVLQQPAQTAIGAAMEQAARALEQGHGDCFVVTCHAVIHELFDRGGEFHPVRFFSPIFAHRHVPTWFSYREPGAPAKWPDEVLVSADCSPDSLIRLAAAIAQRHPVFGQLPPIPSVTGDGVLLHKDLAMELLMKLFYLEDLPHEIEERSTAVNHETLSNALWTAIGESARFQHRAEIIPSSAPTDSFINKWRYFGARVFSIGADHALQPHGVPESQTRIVAWRLPDVPKASTVNMTPNMPDDLQIATDAVSSGDFELLRAILISRGRSWIESDNRPASIKLLEAIITNTPSPSFESLWCKYLLAIAGLFGGSRSGIDLFTTDVHADAVGLGLLFRAERMEFVRKNGGRDEALQLAHGLLRDLGTPDEGITDIERYVKGTATFLIANLLRSGGRYAEATKWIERAEAIFRPSIPSHATELAHCVYAKQVCVAMTGKSSFAMSDASWDETSHQFASALIRLTYSHAAWFSDDIDRALQHADESARQFEHAGTPRYSVRASTVHGLLHIWRDLRSGTTPDYSLVDANIAAGVKAVVGVGDERFLADWFPTLRASKAVGLLQFRAFSRHHDGGPRVQLPWTLQPTTGLQWTWLNTGDAVTLAEADKLLRSRLEIPDHLRVPLLAD
jgi:hypothetical protein